MGAEDAHGNDPTSQGRREWRWWAGAAGPRYSMPRYKVSFSRRWITGRWRFTDRVIHGIGGQPSERSGLQNAWLVEYGGSSAELGGYLTEELKLERSIDARPGAVFEIEELEPRPPPPGSRRASRPRLAPPPPWRAGG